jgi:dTDP-4-amino-4,6-dideoxygalactose transaminase
VEYRGKSLLSYGDFATLSFHATKAFNTFEGGAVIANSAEGKRAVDSARNFGIADEVNIPAVGTNAKMSEFNAALGLLQLDHFEHVRRERGRVDALYRNLLEDVKGITCLEVPEGVVPNHSYFPILVDQDFTCSRDELYDDLRSEGIYSRRYFYPLLSSLPMYSDFPSANPVNLPVASRAASQILCLPIYPELSEADQRRICRCIGG